MSGTSITLVGNATKDPDLRFTNSGVPVVSFGVAVSKRVRDDAGNWVDGATSFFDVSAWKKLAENVAESITKGSRVVVTGRIEQRTYKGNDGSDRTVFEVTADEVAISLFFDPAESKKVTRAAAKEMHPSSARAEAGNGSLFD
jgi:single-strand DNA-binding protein